MRNWEVAGLSHADGAIDGALLTLELLLRVYLAQVYFSSVSAPQIHVVLSDASALEVQEGLHWICSLRELCFAPIFKYRSLFC